MKNIDNYIFFIYNYYSIMNNYIKNIFTLNNKNVNNNNKKKLNKKAEEYQIIDFPKEGTTRGGFFGAIPKEAALSAFDYLSDLINLDSTPGTFLVFTIKNKTNKKKYKYIGSRIELENPIHNRNNNKLHYKNIVGRFKNELNYIDK